MILLCNLDPNYIFCNGIRLIVRAFQDNVIDVEIIGGHYAGKRVFISRIPMALCDGDDVSFL
jgi:ATP-dependent DNA helicase PIF1